MSCGGTWFDNTEWAEIWNRAVASAAIEPSMSTEKKETSSVWTFDDGFFLDAVVDLVFYVPTRGFGAVIQATGQVITEAPGAIFGGAGQLVTGLGDIAGAVFQGTGQLATSLFETTPGIAGDAVDAGDVISGGFFGILDEIFS